MSFVPDPPDAARAGASSPEEAAGTYWRAVTRHWPLVLLVTLLAVGVAVITVKRVGHHYSASASVLVSPLPNTDPDIVASGVVVDTLDPARTVQTAAALLQSPQAAQRTAARMGPAWSRGRVEHAISITPRGQSDVLAVSASAPSASEAARLANAYTSAALAVRAQVVQANVAGELSGLQSREQSSATTSAEKQDLSTRIGNLQAIRGNGRDPSLSIFAQAQVPGSPSGAPTWLILLLACVAGVALGCVAALAIEYFSRRIRDAEDVRAIFPEPILAGIPKVKRARGALSPTDLPPQAFEQLRTLRAQLLAPHYGRVTMVTSADAGDGKTTVATSLACAFGEGSADVILFDIDVIKPDAGTILGLPEPTYDVSSLDGKTPLEDLLVPVPALPRLKVLRAPRGDMLTLDAVITRLPDLLEQALHLADRVILDTPPVGEVAHSLRAAAECDSVLIVVRPRHTDRSRLALVRDQLLRSGAHVAGAVLIGESVGKLAGTYYGYGYAAGAPDHPTEETADERGTTEGASDVSRTGVLRLGEP
jgi:Mrp family chromosome partitioning ATPase